MVYFPTTAWDNIKEFFFMKPILDRAADIASRCVEARSKGRPASAGSRSWYSWRYGPLDERSKPFMMHLWIKHGCNMEWNYEELHNISDSWTYDRYINIFSSPHRGEIASGLNSTQLKKLLKMNGVKGLSKMKRLDLVRAYIAL
jgi:hypothetical protein